MPNIRATIAEAIGVSSGKIEELTARLTDATETASAEIFGEEFPGERELIVEATMRNLAHWGTEDGGLPQPRFSPCLRDRAYQTQLDATLAALPRREYRRRWRICCAAIATAE